MPWKDRGKGKGKPSFDLYIIRVIDYIVNGKNNVKIQINFTVNQALYFSTFPLSVHLNDLCCLYKATNVLISGIFINVHIVIFLINIPICVTLYILFRVKYFFGY